jgi:hypothetical protein
MSDLLEQLLAAHVEHELARLDEPGILQSIDAEVRTLFEQLADVKLNELVTRAQIVGVIERYVIDLKVSGGLTELWGEMSQLVFTSAWSKRTRLDEVLRPESYTAFAEKLGALEGLWRELIHVLVESPAFATLISHVVQREIMQLLFPQPPDDAAAPEAGVASLWPRIVEKLRPSIDQRLEVYLSTFFEAHAAQLAKHSERRLIAVLTPESLRSLSDALWDAVGPMHLSEAFAFINSHDLEDFVVLGYEFWLKYRKTRYFSEIAQQLVGLFFDKYGDDSLALLLDELGVTPAMVTQELKTFVPRLLAHARASGYLAARIRARLEPFYRSSAAAAILAR